MRRQIKRIAFVGAGMIGSGLAVNCILHGYPVVLQTRSKIARTEESVERILKFFEDEQIITQMQKQNAQALYTVTTSIPNAVQDADIIQEAGPEDLDIKKKLYSQIEQSAKEDAIIASSSSRFRCTELQSGLERPERFLCAHPYHPSYLLPLIEIMGGAQTASETISVANAFFSGIGKETVICRRDISGYIANEISWSIMGIAKKYVSQGICSAEDIDRALMYGPGLRLAVTGQMLTINLGTEGGLKNFAQKYGREPEPGIEKIIESIEKEMISRSEDEGRDWESISEYRDRMLVRFLRAKNKL